MTTKTSNTYETIKNTERWPPCQGYSCTYQRLATGFQATAYNEPQHRALPPEPLFLHPTNLQRSIVFGAKVVYTPRCIRRHMSSAKADIEFILP